MRYTGYKTTLIPFAEPKGFFNPGADCKTVYGRFFRSDFNEKLIAFAYDL